MRQRRGTGTRCSRTPCSDSDAAKPAWSFSFLPSCPQGERFGMGCSGDAPGAGTSCFTGWCGEEGEGLGKELPQPRYAPRGAPPLSEDEGPISLPEIKLRKAASRLTEGQRGRAKLQPPVMRGDGCRPLRPSATTSGSGCIHEPGWVAVTFRRLSYFLFLFLFIFFFSR